MYEPSSDLSQKRKSSRDLENERIRILLERQKKQILAEVRSEIQKHELQADGQGDGVHQVGNRCCGKRMGPCTRARSIPESAHGWKGDRSWARLETKQKLARSPKITSVWLKKYPGINRNYWFSANWHWSYYYRVWQIQARLITISRRTIRTKSGSSWNSHWECARHGRIAENSRFLKFEELSRKLTEDQNTIMELRAKIQELQNGVNCMIRMPSQCAVDQPTFLVNQRYFHLIVIQGDCQAATISRQTFGIRRFFGKRFCKSTSVFFITLSSWIQSLDF